MPSTRNASTVIHKGEAINSDVIKRQTFHYKVYYKITLSEALMDSGLCVGNLIESKNGLLMEAL